MNNTKSFLFRLLAITFIIEIIVLAWFFGMPEKFVTPTLPVLPVFFMAVTLLIHKAFLGGMGKNPRQFVTRYMLITTVKLLSFLTIIFIYAVLRKHDAAPFLLSFFVLYLIYSAFEAVEVVRLNKQN